MTPENPNTAEAAVTVVHDLFLHIEKVLKAYRIYDVGHVTIAQFEEQLFEKLQSYLVDHRELTVGVRPYEYIFSEQSVYQNNDKQTNFSFRFHQDGVRQFTFLYGVTLEELRRYLEIVRTDFQSFEYCDEDAVTLLWKAELKHIPYVVVESFVNQGEESEDLEVILGRMAAKHLQDSSLPSITTLLSGASGHVRRRIRRKDADDIMSLPDIGTDFFNEVPNPSDQMNAQMAGEEEAMVRRIGLALFRVLLGVESASEFHSIATVIRRLIESLLRSGQWPLLSKMYGKLRDLSSEASNPSAENASLIRKFYEEINEPTFIDGARKLVLSEAFTQWKELSQFLSVTTSRATPTLIKWFKAATHPELRTALIPALAEGAKVQWDPYVSLIAPENETSLVLASLDLFGTIGTDQALLQIKRAFRHPDAQVRSKVLDLLVPNPATQGTALCLSALKDSHRLVRSKAVDWLTNLKDPKLAKSLYEVIHDSFFDHLDLDEKKKFYMALARLARSQILPMSREELKGGTFDRTTKSTERRIAVLWGLSILGGEEARAIIEEEAQRMLLPNEIKEACDEILAKWPKGSSNVRK